MSLLPGISASRDSVSPIFLIADGPAELVTGLSYAFLNLFCMLYLKTQYDQEEACSGRAAVLGDVSLRTGPCAVGGGGQCRQLLLILTMLCSEAGFCGSLGCAKVSTQGLRS